MTFLWRTSSLLSPALPSFHTHGVGDLRHWLLSAVEPFLAGDISCDRLGVCAIDFSVGLLFLLPGRKGVLERLSVFLSCENGSKLEQLEVKYKGCS